MRLLYQMAPNRVYIIFSIILQDAFRDNEFGVYIPFRTNGNILNLQRLKAKTKITELLVRDLLFDGDCAFIAHSINDIKRINDSFAKAARRFGLKISLKKTEVMFQPKLGTNHVPLNITIDKFPLNVVDKFTYLGSTLSENATIDDDISARLGKPSASFLTKRFWNERGVCLSTKINVYCAVVLTTLLYGCEAWTTYRRHIKQLDQFNIRCLRQMASIKWQDMVLEHCGTRGIEFRGKRAQLRWSGHLVRMTDDQRRCSGQLKTGWVAHRLAQSPEKAQLTRDEICRPTAHSILSC